MELKYFTASWCAPCKTFGPIVESVTKTFGLDIIKIDIEKNPEQVPEDVKSVPTIIKYKDGEEISRIIGGRNAVDFSSWVLSSS